MGSTWQATARLSEGSVVYKGESRLAMALEGGDVRVQPHETCKSRPVALGDVQTCQAAPEDRADPEMI